MGSIPNREPIYQEEQGLTERVGILGGTFDPIHNGHLAMARIAMEEFALDRVVFIPAYRPPHKRRALTPYADRAEMCRLAVAGEPSFEVSDIEYRLGGVSYTYRTLEAWKKDFPQSALYYIIGGDSLFDLPHWYRPERIAAQARVICIPRPGTAEYAPVIEQCRTEFGLEVLPAHAFGPEISSTMIRTRLKEGKEAGEYLPREVAEYAAHVYRAD